MKFLAFAAVASAFVIPDAGVIGQPVPAGKGNNEADPAAASTLHNAVNTVDTVDAIKAGIDKSIRVVNEWLRGGLERPIDTDSEADSDLGPFSSGGLPVFDPLSVGKGKTSNLTIYQLIASCKHTTKFAALVDQFPEVVTLLNTTNATAGNHTLFVPVNSAFDKLPGGGDDLDEKSPAVRESVVRYHVGLGEFTAHREPLLGGEPQRLRVRRERFLEGKGSLEGSLLAAFPGGGSGMRVNFDTRIVAANFVAANGVLHAVDGVVVPPTFVGRELSLARPAEHPFSTLLQAMEVSNFTKYVHGLKYLNGSTVFAPTNAAFTRLGPELNAFLFHTPRGHQYLHALLRYSTVPNATVYSDAFYGYYPGVVGSASTSASVSASTSGGDLVEHIHYQLPTLLGNATVSVNITSLLGHPAVRMLVNDNVRVTVQDRVAKNGAIQEVGHVVFPPAPVDAAAAAAGAALPGDPWVDTPVQTVADLVARLAPYIDDDDDDDDFAAVAQLITEL